MNLYEIAEELNKALAELDGLGLTQEEHSDSLAAIQSEYDTKIESFIGWITCLKSAEIVYKEEAAKLSAKAKGVANKRAWAEGVVLANIQASGKTSAGHGLHVAKLRKPSKIVIIDDESKIPQRYMGYKTEINVRKAAIKQAIKDGAEVKGAHLEDGKTTITIK